MADNTYTEQMKEYFENPTAEEVSGFDAISADSIGNKINWEDNYIHETAIIGKNVTIGKGNYIGPYCIIGFPGEHTGNWPKDGRVIIGDNNKITGLVTIDAGITEAGTIIGNDCFIMKHAHIGHDAVLENNVVISCGAKIGGHTILMEGCNIGLNAVIHQRHLVAPYSLIGMGGVVPKKTITSPFKIYIGNPVQEYGVNQKMVNKLLDKAPYAEAYNKLHYRWQEFKNKLLLERSK